MSLSVIILAAGQGKRMYSSLPKVLHKIGDRSLLEHVLKAVEALAPANIYVVYGHGGEAVKASLENTAITWVEQSEQLGTGHAVQQAFKAKIPADHKVMVLYADVPLIQQQTLTNLVTLADSGKLALLTVLLDDPSGYGRIIRNAQGQAIGIVEHKDADPEQRQINEINTGILAGPAGLIAELVAQIESNNAQGEYYLTDIFALAAQRGVDIPTLQPTESWETQGINNKRQLAELERIYQHRQALHLLDQGVTLRDPVRLDIRGTVQTGRDVEIDVNCVFEGVVTIGDNVRIGPNCVIRDSALGSNTRVEANSIIEQAEIGNACTIGPFARIRPATQLEAGAKIGNFVEVKKAKIGKGTKINHLSYIGDADIGADVNIGAGTITCNYDGVNKHLTVIKDNVFVGSDCQLVAPVTVGEGATLGAGTTVTRDVEADTLTISRVKQQSIKGWKRPQKR